MKECVNTALNHQQAQSTSESVHTQLNHDEYAQQHEWGCAYTTQTYITN